MTHPLLKGGQDPPNAWKVGVIGGGYISFRRPAGNNESECVVIEQGGQLNDGKEDRPVEVWSVTYPTERILMNYKQTGETVGTGVGMSEGAKMALEYMKGQQ